MPNFTVSTDVDSFMQGADFAAMRTSLGVTAETDAREDADNRRAFKGGVYFDGSVVSRAVITDLKLNEISATNFTLFFKGTVDDVSITNRYGNLLGSVRGVGTYVAGKFGLGYNNLNGGQVAFISQTGATTTVKTSNVSCSLHTPFEIACTVNPTTGQVVIYKDGAQVLDETVSGMDLSSTAPCLIFGNQSAADPTIYAHPTGTASDVAILNTALTSTQAAEIYRDGMQPWLAANPEYRRGYASNLTNTWSLGSSNTDFLSNTSSASQITATANSSAGSSGARLLYIFDNYAAEVGSTITATFNVTSITGSVDIKYSLNPSAPSSSGPPVSISSTGPFTYSHTIANKAYGLVAIFGADDAIDATLTLLTVSGALANLPLDDDSRQLKDISGNRNDATASETGVNHLIQKDTHSFRDDNADGTGGSYLIANSDILAENEVITGVTMDGRFYAATEAQDLTKRRIKLVTSGSHIEIKRSDGTTDDAANVTTHPASTTDFAVNVLTQRI